MNGDPAHWVAMPVRGTMVAPLFLYLRICGEARIALACDDAV